MITDEELLELEKLLKEEALYNGANDLLSFTKATFHKFKATSFHKRYYDLIDLFAKKKVKNLIISMPPQHGKEIADSELVLTTKGFKKHKDLKEGDFVFHPSGKPIKVLAEIPQVEKCTVLVTLSNGQKIKCHKNHEWTVIKNGQKTITVETNHFLSNKIYSGEKGKRGCRFVYQLPFTECLEFEEKGNLINPYCLGAWIGDGGHVGSSIHAAEGEEEVLDYFKSLYEITGFSTHKDTGVRKVYFSKGSFLEGLKKENLLGNKHIPEHYILTSKKDRLELLAGLIDTDGSLHKKTGQYRFINTNKSVIDSVCVLLSSLGYSFSLTKAEPRKEPNSSGIQDRKVCYQIGFTPLDKIPCKIPRKQSDKTPKRRKVSIVSVEELPEKEHEEGKCITVDSSDGLYLVGKKLVCSHNSEGSSRRLPAYLAGVRPDDKQALICYNSSKSQKFGREIMSIMREPEYVSIFPEVEYPDRGYTGAKANTNMERESINSRGSMKFVGVNGALTGDPVDVLLMDDLYKDWAEANSPIIRDATWDWYTSVADTRLHNESQQLIVFTRWSKDDLVGRLEKLGKVVDVDLNGDIEEQAKELKNDQFLKFNLPAIQNRQPSLLDPREIGAPLYPERHSLEKLLSSKEKNETQFQCLYQGNPEDKKGMLYGNFRTYEELPELAIVKAYIDTADKGADYLCAIVYGVPLGDSEDIFIIDILYTTDPMEITEKETVNLLNQNDVTEARVESNNGGRGFARVVEREVHTEIVTFTQSKNKESRIITNSSEVTKRVIFPNNWDLRFPEFYTHITEFKKVFSANKHDDCADCLTGVVESNEIDNSPAIIW